jgi:hypothetical protein
MGTPSMPSRGVFVFFDPGVETKPEFVVEWQSWIATV